MRYGGACSDTCTSGQDCVRTPATDNGFSSYFAMDVTDPESPTLLWEFSDAALGFATTGPAIIRTNAVNTVTSDRDRSLNGEWHVVVGSGSTGPIDNTNNQFLGRSNQNQKFFVLNLKTGAPVQTIDTGIQYAFAGSMINSVADFDLDYQDDAVYVGYVKRTGTSPSYTWTDGGIGRIFTKNITPGNTSGGKWRFAGDRRDRARHVLHRTVAEQELRRELAVRRHGAVLLRDPPNGRRSLAGHRRRGRAAATGRREGSVFFRRHGQLRVHDHRRLPDLHGQ
jgi:hypothetical protein